MAGICRLCLGIAKNATPLYGSDDRLLRYIRDCAPLFGTWSENTELPGEVCRECSIMVESVHGFCRTVAHAQRRLAEHLVVGVDRLREFYSTLRSQMHACVKQDIPEENKENILTSAEAVELNEEYNRSCEERLLHSSDDDVTLSALQAEKINRVILKEQPSIKGIDKKRKKTKTNSNVKLKKERNTKNINDTTFFPEGTAEEDKKWQCLTCLVHLESRSSLLSHYKSQHGNSTVCKSEKVVDSKAETFLEEGYSRVAGKGEGGTQMYACSTCGKMFNRRAIARHVRSHNKSRPYQCKLCGRAYRSASDIVLHGRAHSGFKTLFCGRAPCAYSTVYPGALAEHLRRHDSRYKYKCEVCGKGFNVRTWYEEHANVHTGARPFACQHCPKTFHFSRYLTSHRSQVHGGGGAGGGRHACPRCGAALASRRRLRAHLHAAHGEGAPLLCERCGKQLTTPEHLRLHERAHLGVKPHACSSCDKAFAKKCNLTLHERTHSGERPYACTQCGKAFSQRSTLVIHTRYHTGARPYSCEHCPKKFVARGLLSAHQKTMCF